MERTLILIKPDGLQRGIVGEIIGRFEKIGLRIAGAKLVAPNRGFADKHYPKERRPFIEGMGNNTLRSYDELGLNPIKDFGTKDPYKIGLVMQQWLVEYLTSSPVFALVLEGPHAIELVRKLTGPTLPTMAPPGTIRGDYSFDSPVLANASKRVIRNLVHASGNKEEAEFEIKLWFKPAELFDYHSVHQHHMTN